MRLRANLFREARGFSTIRKSVRAASFEKGTRGELSRYFRLQVGSRRARVACVQSQSWWWNGLTPDGSPLVLRDQSSEEIYALDSQVP
jgi:hypothetical protein